MTLTPPSLQFRQARSSISYPAVADAHQPSVAASRSTRAERLHVGAELCRAPVVRQPARKSVDSGGLRWTDAAREETQVQQGKPSVGAVCMSAPGRNRTSDTRFRKPLLSPLSYGGSAVLTILGGAAASGGVLAPDFADAVAATSRWRLRRSGRGEQP